MSAPAPLIVGAGLAGLIAAHAWPQCRVVEAAPAPAQAHRALLRFRTDAVAQLTGVEFRRVSVRKSVWYKGRHVAPDLALANMYAQKVAGALVGDRSIWNLAPAERWVAPDTLYEQLVDAVGQRIAWNHSADFAGARRAMISTAPLPVVLDALGVEHALTFERAPIVVRRYRIARADIFQTVYFPDLDTGMYRASITGDLLIVESMASDDGSDLDAVVEAFGLRSELSPLERVRQSYGKIVPLPDVTRKQLLFRLTHEHGIFSLGRFATWRNILLDDVVKDIAVIKRLLRSSLYDVRAAAT